VVYVHKYHARPGVAVLVAEQKACLCMLFVGGLLPLDRHSCLASRMGRTAALFNTVTTWSYIWSTNDWHFPSRISASRQIHTIYANVSRQCTVIPKDSPDFIIHCVQEKRDQNILVISPIKLGRLWWKLVHRFLNKFASKWCQRFPPQLNSVCTLENITIKTFWSLFYTHTVEAMKSLVH